MPAETPDTSAELSAEYLRRLAAVQPRDLPPELGVHSPIPVQEELGGGVRFQFGERVQRFVILVLLECRVRGGEIWIEIDRMGAYSNATATHFNGFHPETLIVTNDQPMAAG